MENGIFYCLVEERKQETQKIGGGGNFPSIPIFFYPPNLGGKWGRKSAERCTLHKYPQFKLHFFFLSSLFLGVAFFFFFFWEIMLPVVTFFWALTLPFLFLFFILFLIFKGLGVIVLFLLDVIFFFGTCFLFL